MAFYHVGSCSCPSGCCDCGVEYVYYNPWRNRFEIVLGSEQSRRVKDYWEYLGELNAPFREKDWEDL